MKRLIQSVTEPGKGNCLATCVACLLEIPVESVPDLNIHFDGFLLKHGLTAARLKIPNLQSCWVGHTPAYCILIGDSPRRPGVQHAVIGRPNGYGYMIIHDPHPQGGGLKGDPTSVIYLMAADLKIQDCDEKEDAVLKCVTELGLSSPEHLGFNVIRYGGAYIVLETRYFMRSRYVGWFTVDDRMISRGVAWEHRGVFDGFHVWQATIDELPE